MHMNLLFRRKSSPIDAITEKDQYAALVESTRFNERRLAVVEFSSEQCKACKALKPRFEKMAQDWPTVEFYMMNYEAGTNKQTFKQFGIRRLPHMHVIAKGEEVESFLCPSSKLARLELKLNEHGPWLRGYRGWFSGRRWARLRWNRSNWWRLRPKLLGGRRDGLVAAKLVPKAEADSTKGPDGALGPSALSFDARVRISGLEAESARGFNGLSARVKQWDEEEGRYVVEIDVSDNQRKLLSLKPEKVESL